jgi:DNA repair exonuclease SbcCD ATPase subunit
MRKLARAVKALNKKLEARLRRLGFRKEAYLQAKVRLEQDRRETAAFEAQICQAQVDLAEMQDLEADLSQLETEYAQERVTLDSLQKHLLEEAKSLLKEM